MKNLKEAAVVSEAWDAYIHAKYATDMPDDPLKKETKAFRDYTHAEATVTAFYRENHKKQTLAHVLAMKQKYGKLDKAILGVWEALEVLNGLVDESDPDTAMPQIVHALQSAEAARRDNQPRWMILTALIHDLGKYLFFVGEPQWTVVGDTFPVGCRFAPEIVHPDFFKDNPDTAHPTYASPYGIYAPQCGLENVHLSFGHDEYLAMVCKNYLPPEAVYIIRHHSFYSCHTDGAYTWMMTDHDHTMMRWVKEFNKYDLYSKAEEPPCVETLRPYYQELIAEYFPEKICW